MKLRYVLTGGTILGIAGMATALGILGTQNISKQQEIDDKKIELNDKQGIYPPPESRILKSASSPAYPSPGYEN